VGCAPAVQPKPFGHGYDGFREFFAGYAGGLQAAHSPELGRSLHALLSDPAKEILRSVGASPVCLIEGISCPYNGMSLRHCLAHAGVSDARVHALDILDVDAVARSLGYELPGLEFSIGDASRLDGWESGSVHVLVQDHLLNCAPHAIHAALVREAARVLHGRGVWILNFSLEPHVAGGGQIGFQDVEQLLGRPLDSMAYCLSEIANGRGVSWLLERLLGKMIVDERTGRRILITAPHGNFEFYFPLLHLESLLAANGLETVFRKCEQGVDQHGNHYQRHRTLVRHAAPAPPGEPSR